MDTNIQKKASRRGFISVLAAGAAASMVAPLQAAANPAFSVTNASDIQDWFKQIKGKHRIVFDAPEFNEGMPLAFPRVFQITNNNTGVDNKDLGVVVVFRHNAMALGLDSRVWEKYKLGELFNIPDPATGKPSLRNFFWKPQKGELVIPGMSIDELQSTGGLFCVCEMAILHYSGVAAKKMGLDHETVRKDWLAGVLPGVQPVPSGVFAVNRAQEQGCSYCFAG